MNTQIQINPDGSIITVYPDGETAAGMPTKGPWVPTKQIYVPTAAVSMHITPPTCQQLTMCCVDGQDREAEQQHASQASADAKQAEKDAIAAQKASAAIQANVKATEEAKAKAAREAAEAKKRAAAANEDASDAFFMNMKVRNIPAHV